MRKSRFTEAQIVAIIREYDAGTPVAELARKHGIHANTIRLWKSKYQGMEVADVVRLKELETDNVRMERIIAKLTLKVCRHGRADPKKRLGPSQRQEAVKALQRSGLSQRAACAIIRARRQSPGTLATEKAQADAKVIVRLTELAQRWPRRGCKRLYDRYEREARDGDEYMNVKRFRRLYRLGNLQLPRRRRLSRAKYVRGLPLRRAMAPNEICAMDFLADRLFYGRRFRVHTLLDECSRYSFSVSGAFSFPSIAVVAKLEEIAHDHGYPKCLRVDNGPEHIASVLERWADEHDVELLFIEPGKPTQNAFIESFNARVCDELLNPNRFRTIFTFNEDAEEWHMEYNTGHPHSGLDGKTPEEFLALYETTRPPQLLLAS